MFLYSVAEIQKSRLVHHNLKKNILDRKKGYHLALIDENFATYLLRTKVKIEWFVILKSTCQGTLKSKNGVATL